MQSSSAAADGGKDAKKVVLFPPQSVALVAESAGFEISSEIASAISDDVTYRIREIVNVSNQFLRHSKRKRLTANDVNRALNWSDVPSILGHSSEQPPNYVHVPAAGVWTTEDREITLEDEVFEPIVIAPAEEDTLKAQWTSLCGSVASSSEDAQSASLTPLTETQQIYCMNVLTVLASGPKNQLQSVMRDLQSNPNLGGIAPYLCLELRKLMSDARRKSYVLYAMQRMLLNKHLPFATVTGLDQMMEAAMELLLATPSTPEQSYQRDQAALLIGQATTRLGQNFSSKFARSLKEVMGSSVREVSAMVGCVKGAVAMGPQAVQDCVMPVFAQLLDKVDSVTVPTGRSSTSYLAEAIELHAVLVDAVKCVVRSRMLELQNAVNNPDDIAGTPFTELCDTLNMLYQISAQHIAPFLVPSYPSLDYSFRTNFLERLKYEEESKKAQRNAFVPSSSSNVFKVPYPVGPARAKGRKSNYYVHPLPRKRRDSISSVFETRRMAPDEYIKFNFIGATPVPKQQLQRKVQSALYFTPGTDASKLLARTHWQRKIKLRRHFSRNILSGALDAVL